MTTRVLARFTSSLQAAELLAATIDKAKCLLMDGIGCLLAGVVAEPGRNAAAFAQQLGGASDQSTVYAMRRS